MLPFFAGISPAIAMPGANGVYAARPRYSQIGGTHCSLALGVSTYLESEDLNTNVETLAGDVARYNSTVQQIDSRAQNDHGDMGIGRLTATR